MSGNRIIAAVLLLLFLIIPGCSEEAHNNNQLIYVGSINSDKYHYPDCRWAENIKPENEIWFSSTEDAEEQRYVPCKTCQP